MKQIILLMCVLALCGCGIKGKPLPPLPEEPLISTDVEKTESVSPTMTTQPKTR